MSESNQDMQMRALLVSVVFSLTLSTISLVATLDAVQANGSEHVASWSHLSQAAWARDFPLCASGSMRPSPIDINTCQTEYRPDLNIRLKNYNHEIPVNLMTTHHSVSVKPNINPTPSVRLNWLPKKEREFDLQEIHFHWDTDGDHKGSEHAINGNLAAAEMHLVHFKRGINKEDIGKIENSIVVLGVLIQSDNMEHRKIQKLVRDLSKVNGTDTEFDGAEPELLIDLLPENRKNFFVYNGSLTTPPCYEVVTWVVMNSPIYMSREQLDQLANLEFKEADGMHKKIGPNHRYIQPLHDRPVLASFNVSDPSVPRRKLQNSLILKDNWHKVVISLTMNGQGNDKKTLVNTRVLQ